MVLGRVGPVSACDDLQELIESGMGGMEEKRDGFDAGERGVDIGGGPKAATVRS